RRKSQCRAQHERASVPARCNHIQTLSRDAIDLSHEERSNSSRPWCIHIASHTCQVCLRWKVYTCCSIAASLSVPFPDSERARPKDTERYEFICAARRPKPVL